MLCDGLDWFRAVSTGCCNHETIGIGGNHPSGLQSFSWIKTLLANLKSSFSDIFYAFILDK
jgi:hypothetical protein